jgi:long-chain fatty acid transport protein
VFAAPSPREFSPWLRRFARGSGPRAPLLGGVATLALLCALAVPTPARAGGMEIPENGAQALGRGGAFVAKADDSSAMYLNPAGLARQRGTRAFVGANLFIHSFSFQRNGTYFGDKGSSDYAGSFYPQVDEVGGPSLAPIAAVTTDFESFDRLTFGVGLLRPSMIGNRTFPLGVANAVGGQVPSPSRYDAVQQRQRILMPSASAAVRVTKWLDLGVTASFALGSFAETNNWYLATDAAKCPAAETQGCDVRNEIDASGSAFVATLGALVRPSPRLAFGASVRTPASFAAGGTITSYTEGGTKGQAPSAIGVYTKMPMVARVGVRHVTLDKDFELYDLELDATYEGWRSAQGDGVTYQIEKIGNAKSATVISRHAWGDTYGARLGGSYNLDLSDAVLSLRGGAFFDSSAASFEATRLDYDTLSKLAGTFGLGYRWGAFQFDASYAAVASIQRTVGSTIGKIRPINPGKKNVDEDPGGKVMPAINEGSYKGFTHVLSVGVTVALDTFLASGAREVKYREDWEPAFVRPGAKGGARPESTPSGRPASRALETEPIGTSDKIDRGEKPSKPEPEKPEKPSRPEPEKPEKPSRPPERPSVPDRPEAPVVPPVVTAPPPVVAPPPPKKPEPPPPPPKKWWEDDEE